jgi:hypothetical protein
MSVFLHFLCIPSINKVPYRILPTHNKTIHNPSESIALLTDYRFNANARFLLPGGGEFDERLVVDVEPDDVKTDLLALQHRDATVLRVRQPAGRLHQSDCQDLRQKKHLKGMCHKRDLTVPLRVCQKAGRLHQSDCHYLNKNTFNGNVSQERSDCLTTGM